MHLALFSSLWLLIVASAAGPMRAGADEPVRPIYPVTTGSSYAPSTPLARVVIASTQTGPSAAAAVEAAKDVFRRGGITVIEPSSAGARPAERHGSPTERAGRDHAFLALGKQAGADHVVIVEVTDTLVLDHQRSVGRTYLHDERVAVRALGVNNGAVVLEGTARWSLPIERAGDHMRELTAYALARALCPPDKWVEASAFNRGRGRCRS